jgi:hypothetical protein
MVKVVKQLVKPGGKDQAKYPFRFVLPLGKPRYLTKIIHYPNHTHLVLLLMQVLLP